MQPSASFALINFALVAPWLALAQDAKPTDLDFAHGLYGRKEYRLAAEEYQNFIRKSPPGALADEAHFFLAESLVQLRRPVEAIENYAKLLDGDGVGRQHFRMALFRSGELQLERGDFAKAAAHFEKFIARFAGDPLMSRAHFQLGEAEMGAARFVEAAAAFEKAARSENPNIALAAAMGRARALIRLGGGDGVALVEKLLRDNSLANSDRMVLDLGMLLLEAGKAEAAIDAFDRMLRQFPQSSLAASARLARAQALDAQGKLAEAEAGFRDLLEEAAWPSGDPGRGEAWLWYGLAQLKKSKPEQAAITFRQAERLFPNHPRAAEFALQAAVADLENGKPKEARPQFEGIASAGAGGLANRARVYAARCQLEENDFQAVYRTYAALAEAKPSPAENDRMVLVATQAVARDDSLDAAQKERLFQRLTAAASTAHTKLEIKRFVADSHFRAGQFDRCKEAARSLLDERALPLLRVQTLYLIGLCELRLKNWEAAATAFEEAVDIGFDSVQGAESGGYQLPADLVLGLAAGGAQAAAALEPGNRSRRLLDKLTREASRRKNAVPALLKIAGSLHAGRRLTEARRVYDKILQMDAPKEDLGKVLTAVAWAEYENGDFVRAAERFTSAAAAFSVNSPARVDAAYMAAVATERTLGESSGESGNADQKVQALAQSYLQVHALSDTSERGVDAGFRAARMLSRLKRFDEARQLLDKMAAAASDRPEFAAKIAYERAWQQFETGAQREALTEFQRLLQQFPQASFAGEAALKAAEIAANLRQFAEAERLAALAVERTSDRIQKSAALFRLGNSALELRRWDAAKAAFERLAESGSARESALSVFWLGEIEFLREKPAAALAHFQKLLSLDAAGELALTAQLRCAQCALALKQYEQALEQSTKFLATHPSSPLAAEAVVVQGRVLIRQARFDDARAKLEAALIDKSEAAARAQFLIGQTYFHQDRFDDAIKAFLKVEILYSYPRWQSLALLEAAKCYDRKKDIAAAKTIYARLLEKFPDSESAVLARRLAAEIK